MKPKKDTGYVIRCTGKETGDIKFLFISSGTKTLGNLLPKCFGTLEEAQTELDGYDKSAFASVDMDIAKVTVIVEDP